jgi:hypothetical protein
MDLSGYIILLWVEAQETEGKKMKRGGKREKVVVAIACI